MEAPLTSSATALKEMTAAVSSLWHLTSMIDIELFIPFLEDSQRRRQGQADGQYSVGPSLEKEKEKLLISIPATPPLPPAQRRAARRKSSRSTRFSPDVLSMEGSRDKDRDRDRDRVGLTPVASSLFSWEALLGGLTAVTIPSPAATPAGDPLDLDSSRSSGSAVSSSPAQSSESVYTDM